MKKLILLEVYLGPCRTFMMECFAKKVRSNTVVLWRFGSSIFFLTILTKIYQFQVLRFILFELMLFESSFFSVYITFNFSFSLKISGGGLDDVSTQSHATELHHLMAYARLVFFVNKLTKSISLLN